MNHLLRTLLPSVILMCSYGAIAQTSEYTDSIKNVVARQTDDTPKMKNFFVLGGSYLQFNPDSSLMFAQKALALAEKLKYQEAIFGANVLISQSLMLAGNYPLQLEYCFKALTLAKKIGDTSGLFLANTMLSDCYYHLGNYTTSLNYLRVVLHDLSSSHPEALYQVWINLSKLFGDMHQPDSALLYAKKSFESLKQVSCFHPEEYVSKVQLSTIDVVLGNAFLGKLQYDSAYFYYHSGALLSADILLQTDMIDDYNGMSAVFQATGKADSAIAWALKILQEPITKKYPAGMLKAAGILSEIYQAKHKPDSALKYLRIAVAVKDSLFNNEKMLAAQNLTWKEQEKQSELANEKNNLARRYKEIFLVASSFVILVIAGIVLRNKRQKHLQQMRNSIANDLHDDIGSTLSSISIMSELAKQKLPDALPLLSSIGENSLVLQENMSDIVWAVNPANDPFNNTLQRMNQFAAEILEGKNIELEFASDPSLAAVRLTMAQRKNFYLFFKEVINNAAKYSDAKKCVVCIYYKDHHITMTIEDDGKGFDSTSVFNGNGMTTLKKRSDGLRAQYSITSCTEKGTAVQLKFRIT